MNSREFLEQTDLENTFVVGYYGGGNFGDELLLEVILYILSEKKEKDVSFFYSDQVDYDKFHKDFGYEKISLSDKVNLIKSFFFKKNIIIGGGGLWGLDTNIRTFIMFVIVFFSALAFRTNVYAIGVGYYNSTNRLGRIGAWLIGKVAKKIIVRDQESFTNFKSFTENVVLSDDIAELIPELDNIGDRYYLQKEEFPDASEQLTLIFNREMRGKKKSSYNRYIKNYIRNNKSEKIYLVVCDGKDVFKDLYQETEKLAKENNVEFFYLQNNPLDFYFYLQESRKNFKIIAPQFHVIILSILMDIDFLPIYYDNKVLELYKKRNIENPIEIASV